MSTAVTVAPVCAGDQRQQAASTSDIEHVQPDRSALLDLGRQHPAGEEQPRMEHARRNRQGQPTPPVGALLPDTPDRPRPVDTHQQRVGPPTRAGESAHVAGVGAAMDSPTWAPARTPIDPPTVSRCHVDDIEQSSQMQQDGATVGDQGHNRSPMVVVTASRRHSRTNSDDEDARFPRRPGIDDVGMQTFRDDFSGPVLDTEVWVPHDLPAWSSRARQAPAAFELGDGGLRLFIPPGMGRWRRGHSRGRAPGVGDTVR